MFFETVYYKESKKAVISLNNENCNIDFVFLKFVSSHLNQITRVRFIIAVINLFLL